MEKQSRKGLAPLTLMLLGAAGFSLVVAIGLCGLMFMEGTLTLPIPHQLTYRVTGSASRATIMHGVGGAQFYQEENLPYQRTVTVYGLNFDLEVDVQADGPVTCEILLDGRTLVTANGATTANCTATGSGSSVGAGGYGNGGTVQP